jgi:hypothetical protein
VNLHESARDAAARQIAYRAHQQRAEAREAAEAAEYRVRVLAVAMRDGRASEEQVLEAMDEHDRAARLLTAWNIAAGDADSDAAIVGRA